MSLHLTQASDLLIYLKKLQVLFDICNSLDAHLIWRADFNLNFQNTLNSDTKLFMKFVNSFGLEIGTRETTGPSTSGGSCIDSFVTSIHKDNRKYAVLKQYFFRSFYGFSLLSTLVIS